MGGTDQLPFRITARQGRYDSGDVVGKTAAGDVDNPPDVEVLDEIQD